jgi:predicted TIM-barrel enzyme
MNRDGGIQKLVDDVAADIESLQAAGVDAIMFGNEATALRAPGPPEGLAAMAAIVATLKPAIRVPMGVNYLWDPVATVASRSPPVRSSPARSSPASTPPTWASGSRNAPRRSACATISAAPTSSCSSTSTPSSRPRSTPAGGLKARSAVFSSKADIICVSGPLTGQAADQSELSAVKAALPETPVFANTRRQHRHVTDTLAIADGVVIGTHFKRDGNTWNPVDRDRAARFMDRVRQLR